MIEFSELLSPDSIDCHVEATTKKKALQRLSENLCRALCENTNTDVEDAADGGLCEMDILDALIGRERLGSTGLGRGVSLPHGRLGELAAPVAGLITLSEGVEFEAPDNQTVDILFGLLVPQDSTDEHLQILAQMAEAFSDEELCIKIRQCEAGENQHLHELLQSWSLARTQARAQTLDAEQPPDPEQP